MSKSLTDAVKAAATQSASLTDAVKEAARSGVDSTVINFPRLAFGGRHETTPNVGIPKAAEPHLDVPASATTAAQREDAPERPAEEGTPPESIAGHPSQSPGRPGRADLAHHGGGPAPGRRPASGGCGCRAAPFPAARRSAPWRAP